MLLPPSETKRPGGDGPPLDLADLSFRSLTALRAELVDDLVTLAADPAASRAALGISAKQDDEIERNATLRTSPTMAAIDRYTGVLYDALDVDSLKPAAAARARARLVVCSALFGLLRADDPIPAYRLSAGSKLPSRPGSTSEERARKRPGASTPRPGLAVRWRPLLEPALAALAADELVVDLRSGAYAGLGKVPGAVTVDVLSQAPNGQRSVVSHFNKAHKGRLAQVLATSRADPDDAAKVAGIARRAGMRVERDGDHLTLVLLP